MHDFNKVRNRIGTYSFKWDQYHDPDIVALGTADMDFDSPEEVREALVKRAQEGFYGYEDKSNSYYEAIIGWYKRRYDWEIKQEWLSNVPGVWTAMHLCVEAFTEPGDAVLVHSPRFSPIPNIVKGCRRRMVTNPMEFNGTKYEINFETMEKTIREENVRAFIMINPQNPSGRVFNEDELVKIGMLCDKYGVSIISDEVHGNIVYDGHKHYPACSVSPELKRRAAIITAPSKAFNLQGLTYGIVIIPDENLRKKFEAERSGYNMEFASNVFSLVATETAYRDCDQWLDDLNRYLQENLDYLEAYFKENIPEIGVIRPEGSYMVWLDCRKLGMDPEQLRRFLLNAHIGFTYGDSFGPEGDGFERINIGCPRVTLEKCLERLRNAVEALDL